MAKAAIFQAAEEYRRAVNRNELEALRRLSRLWVPSYKYLREQFSALTQLIESRKNEGKPVEVEYLYSFRRYRTMMEQARKMISQYNRAAAGEISGAEAEAAGLGTKRGTDLVNIAEPDDPMWTRVNSRETRIMSGMLSEASPLSELLDKSFSQTREEIDRALITGISTGQGSSWIADQLANAAQVPLQRALVIARTEVNRAYRQANLETMRSSRAVRGYRRMCYPPTACFACLMMDGEYYDKMEDFSDHPNGKCSAVPVTKHFDPGADPNWQRGRDWFMQQDEDTQRKLMGPGRFELWSSGGVDLRDMVYIKPNDIWGGSPAIRSLEELKTGINMRFISSPNRRDMANGMRKPVYHELDDKEIYELTQDILAIEADPSVFRFNTGRQTGYRDDIDIINVRGDVFPDLSSKKARDRMSSRAVLAHEYYGHRANRGTPLPNGAWNDEFRASYLAAKNAPGLSDEDRYYLIQDAIDRAREAGIKIRYNQFMNEVLYGQPFQ